ncbi:hypothetical protein BKA65DRAFT_484842 [Rhexocercosporidium sp. MPI-PUGE-AT-0058]|nr:hypothetical protein BKA65DRAFT_484842 [Rhexocercosporidium sp. MPI-PUGE-AT-0058]
MGRVKALLAALPPLTIPDSPVHLYDFTLFPKLPANLRQHIWSFAASESRYIKIIELDRRLPPSYQNWDSRVAGQQKNPGIIGACRESQEQAKKKYRRCFEKAQRSPEDEEKQWRGSQAQLKQAKHESIASGANRGTALYVNFTSDIFILSKCPATEHECRSDHPVDYNLKPAYLRFIHRLQQTYSEEKGMSFPLLLFGLARIWDYGVELDEASKKIVGALRGVDRELHLMSFKYTLMRGLLHFSPDLPPQAAMEKWNVELR